MNKLFPLLAFSILLLAPVGAQNVSAMPIVLTPTDDAFITDTGANGTPDVLSQGGLIVVNFSPASFEDQGIIEFDVSGIPPGTIASATLDLNVVGVTPDFPFILNVLGYTLPHADGVVALSDFSQGAPIDNPPIFFPGNIATDVTPFVTSAVANGDPFVGFNLSGIGTNFKTLRVSSAETGNPTNPTLTIVFADTVAPTALCQDVTVPLDANGQVSVSPGVIDAGSSDNVQILSVTLSPNSFSCSELGANTVTLTVTDTSGNTSTCQAAVAVLDPQNACSANNQVIGGEMIPIETTSLLLVGAQSTTWLIPVVLSVMGIGLVLVRRK